MFYYLNYDNNYGNYYCVIYSLALSGFLLVRCGGYLLCRPTTNQLQPWGRRCRVRNRPACTKPRHRHRIHVRLVEAACSVHAIVMTYIHRPRLCCTSRAFPPRSATIHNKICVSVSLVKQWSGSLSVMSVLCASAMLNIKSRDYAGKLTSRELGQPHLALVPRPTDNLT